MARSKNKRVRADQAIFRLGALLEEDGGNRALANAWAEATIAIADLPDDYPSGRRREAILEHLQDGPIVDVLLAVAGVLAHEAATRRTSRG